ncbi:P-loop containing nucleoside triphosphate hydrolase protein [Chytriomyces cf. hyalinus JEL632]|nr:P-loop containing nucleoside triphosphate hydrolase protein [Chytriomyces cf. hyalinus JEL632]
MAKKKKASGPVRGFATTSVASKASVQAAQVERDAVEGAERENETPTVEATDASHARSETAATAVDSADDTNSMQVVPSELSNEWGEEAGEPDEVERTLTGFIRVVRSRVDREIAVKEREREKDTEMGVPWLRLDAVTENVVGAVVNGDRLETCSAVTSHQELLHAYVTLTRIGFSASHAEAALRNSLRTDTDAILQAALDWVTTAFFYQSLLRIISCLCIHLPPDELPKRYTDKVALDVDTTVTLSVQQNSNNDPRPRETVTHLLSDAQPLQSSLPSEVASKDTSRDMAAIKTRILQSMLEHSDSDEDSDSSFDANPINSLSPNALHALFQSHLYNLKLILSDKCKPLRITPPPSLLTAIKEYSQRLKKLESERAFQKRKAEVEYANLVNSQNKLAEKDKEYVNLMKRIEEALVSSQNNEAVEPARNIRQKNNIANDDEDEDDDISGLFSELTASSTHNAILAAVTATTILSFPVPKSWSGKLPAHYLQEQCAKLIPSSAKSKTNPLKIKYEKLPTSTSKAYKARATITGFPSSIISSLVAKAAENNNTINTSGTTITFETPSHEAVDTLNSAQEHVATLALFNLFGASLPLYRSLPPAYRDFWIELEEAQRNSADMALKLEEDAILDVVSGLFKEYEELVKARNATNADARKSKNAFGSMQEASINTQNDEGSKSDTLRMEAQSDSLREKFEARTRNASYIEMKEFRSQLPVSNMRDELLKLIEDNQVVIVSGETGSGKSTQIPQFLLESALLSNKASQTSIICTQPRRISATSIASRVSQELGDPNGFGPGSLVAYTVRLDSTATSSTRLSFQTTGVLLRRLEQDPYLQGISHILVDEVHERSLDSDFLLLCLRRLVSVRRSDLRVILMSATADAEKFARYFETGFGGAVSVPVVRIPGRTFPVEAFFLEDAVEQSGYEIDAGSEYAVRERYGGNVIGRVSVSGKGGNKNMVSLVMEDGGDDEVNYYDGDGNALSEKTRDTLRKMDLRKIDLDLVEALIRRLVGTKGSHKDDTLQQAHLESILVFLPGIGEIRKLHDRLTSEHSKENQKYKMLVLPLHSTLTSAEQAAVFKSAPRGVRKVVLSTNIAETGVTIPDVVYVIDTCRAREVSYDEKRNLTRLGEVLISQANCRQRRGRAGRVKPGVCFHLIPRHQFDTMQVHRPPEMLRLPLEELVLRVLASSMLDQDIPNVRTFMAQAPDPPPVRHVERAITVLKQIQAISEKSDDSNPTSNLGTETLTPLGQQLAGLPVDVRLGKMLLFAVMLKCLDPVLTIAASLSLGKDPFLTRFEDSTSSGAAKRFKSGESDLLAIANAFNAWRDHIIKNGRDRNSGWNAARDFAQRNGLSITNLTMIEEARLQLLRVLASSGIVKLDSSKGAPPRPLLAHVPSNANTAAKQTSIILAVLAAGVYPSVAACLTPSPGTASTKVPSLYLQNNLADKVQVHSRSIVSEDTLVNGSLYGMYSVTKTVAGGGSGFSRIVAWDLNLLGNMSVLTFAGNCFADHQTRLLKADSGKLAFRCVPRTAAFLSALFRQANKVFDKKLSAFSGSDQRGIAGGSDTEEDTRVVAVWLSLIEAEFSLPSKFK